MYMPVGAMENTISSRANGENLIGPVKIDRFEATVEKGSVKGKVSFIITMDFGALKYDGAVAGDELKFKVLDGSRLN